MNSTTIEEIKAKAVPILKHVGATRGALFGSFARGEQKNDSDIDILVELPDDLSLFDMGGILSDLETALGRKVDLVEYGNIKARLKPYILQDAISIL